MRRGALVKIAYLTGRGTEGVRERGSICRKFTPLGEEPPWIGTGAYTLPP